MNPSIPLVDLVAQYQSIKSDIDAALGRVLARADFVSGLDVAAFEEEFARFCGTRFGVSLNSGTDALRLALLAAGFHSGDEVITVPNTFIATVEAVTACGASPVFVDIDPQTQTMDPSQAAERITPCTRALLPVHLFGHPADMDPLRELAQRHGLFILEDAAQAHGALYRVRRAGSLGHAAAFSFYPSKNLGAYGDAGMVVTDLAELAERVRLLRDHGRTEKYIHQEEGGSSRMDTLQAAVLRAKLQHLERWNERRRHLAEVYNQRLQAVQQVQVPYEAPWAWMVYYVYVVRVPQRDALKQHLAAAGIATGIHYPVPLHLQPAYRWLGHQEGDFPHAERAAQEILSLPMYPELGEDQIDRIASAIAAFYR